MTRIDRNNRNLENNDEFNKPLEILAHDNRETDKK